MAEAYKNRNYTTASQTCYLLLERPQLPYFIKGGCAMALARMGADALFWADTAVAEYTALLDASAEGGGQGQFDPKILEQAEFLAAKLRSEQSDVGVRSGHGGLREVNDIGGDEIKDQKKDRQSLSSGILTPPPSSPPEQVKAHC